MDTEEIKERIKKIKADVVSKDDQNKKVSPLGVAMKMGTEFVAAVFVASFIGFYIDKWLETTPFLML